MYPKDIYSIDGYTFDFLVPTLFGKEAFAPDFMVQLQMNYYL
jgi:hypothetical protein